MCKMSTSMSWAGCCQACNTSSEAATSGWGPWTMVSIRDASEQAFVFVVGMEMAVYGNGRDNSLILGGTDEGKEGGQGNFIWCTESRARV